MSKNDLCFQQKNFFTLCGGIESFFSKPFCLLLGSEDSCPSVSVGVAAITGGDGVTTGADSFARKKIDIIYQNSWCLNGTLNS